MDSSVAIATKKERRRISASPRQNSPFEPHQLDRITFRIRHVRLVYGDFLKRLGIFTLLTRTHGYLANSVEDVKSLYQMAENRILPVQALGRTVSLEADKELT